MPHSQNARFTLSPPDSVSEDHPPGEWLAGWLAAELERRGWVAAVPQDWRDAGWEFVCSQPGSRLVVTLAQLNAPTDWMLQVAPANRPGLMALVGRRPSATPVEVFRLAEIVHDILAARGALSSLGWRWDGEPKDASCSPRPEPAG